MKKIKWKLDLSKSSTDVNKESLTEKNYKNAFESTVNLGLDTSHVLAGGLSPKQLRISIKVFDKLEATNSNYIILEDQEFELVKKAVQEGKFPTGLSRVVDQLMTFVDEAHDPTDSKGKKKKKDKS